jgi:hypothetical protein
MTRGDSFEIPLFLNQGTATSPLRYILSDKDEVYFGVMECNQPFENALIRKKFTHEDLNKNGDVVVSFRHEDTVNVIPDMYYYEIKLRSFNAIKNTYEVHTVVQKTKFFIEE